jgi:hypothetical protein
MSAEVLSPNGFAPIREHLVDYAGWCILAAEMWGWDWFATLLGRPLRQFHGSIKAAKSCGPVIGQD